MPKPKVEIGATCRPGLRGNSASPLSEDGKSPTRSRVNAGKSPVRSRANAGKSPTRHTPKDEISSDEDISDDKVDGTTTHRSPKLYPDLPPPLRDDFDSQPNRSPSLESGVLSHDDSYDSAQSQCFSRTPTSAKKASPKTPEQSPRKIIHPPSFPNDGRQPKRGASPIMLIFFVSLVLGCILFLFHSIEETDQINKSKVRIRPIQEIYQVLKDQIRSLSRDFYQTKYFWTQLIGQLNSMMVMNPSQPAVILVVVPEDARRTGSCLIHKIAEAVKFAFEDSKFVMYDVKSEALLHHNNLKLELDNALRELVDAHAAVIHGIETIPGEAAMIFHAFCDNENAPFKQAIIFPVLEVHGHYEDLVSKRLDSTVDDLLMQTWGVNLKIKDVSAIVSRIANAPVLIKPESSEKLHELCPI